jgi:hypothetical protein
MEIESVRLPAEELELLGKHVDIGDVDDVELAAVELGLDELLVAVLEGVIMEKLLGNDGRVIQEADVPVPVALGLTVTGLEPVLSEIVPTLGIDSVPFEVGYRGIHVEEGPPDPPISVLLGAILITIDEEELVAVALLGVEE